MGEASSDNTEGRTFVPPRNRSDLRDRLSQVIPGQSSAIHEYRENVLRFLPSQDHLLIRGEQGSGKSFLVDEVLPHIQPWAGRPLVCVLCPALPDDLAASELFGHAKGAFTGAGQPRTGLMQAAEGGTVFLEEVADLPLHVQAMLLRFLDCGKIRPVGANQEIQLNVRVIAATNRDLDSMVQANTFRGDLYSRLRTLTLRVPPLRELGQDIVPMAYRVLKQLREAKKVAQCSFTRDAEIVLQQHAWPANIRELKSVLVHASHFSEEEQFDAPTLKRSIAHYADLAYSPACAIHRCPDQHCKTSHNASLPPASPPVLTAEDERFLDLFCQRLHVVFSQARVNGTGRFDHNNLIEQAGLAASIDLLGPRVTQNRLADFFGVSQSTISRWLHTRSIKPVCPIDDATVGINRVAASCTDAYSDSFLHKLCSSA